MFLVPRTQSSHAHAATSDCELRVQRGTRTTGHVACYRPRGGTRPRMSTQVVGTTLRPQRAGRTRRRLLRLDTVIMAAAVVSLIVLVVLPLAFLLIGSFWSKDGA